MEVQVRMNTGGSVAGSVSNWKVISPGIVTLPIAWRYKTKHHINRDGRAGPAGLATAGPMF